MNVSFLPRSPYFPGPSGQLDDGTDLTSEEIESFSVNLSRLKRTIGNASFDDRTHFKQLEMKIFDYERKQATANDILTRIDVFQLLGAIDVFRGKGTSADNVCLIFNQIFNLTFNQIFNLIFIF